MFRNTVAAALRHLSRSRVQALVSVGGLAVGLCAASIAALVIRNQYTFDHFIPDHDRTYAVQVVFSPPGLPPEYAGLTLLSTAERLRTAVPGIEAVTRILEDRRTLRLGDRTLRENLHWADPNAFDVLPLPVHAGDARAALGSAGGLVLSRGTARRLFGRDAPLGETLLVDTEPMTVRAIIEDLPAGGTHQQRGIIGSGLTRISPMHTGPQPGDELLGNEVLGSGYTYVRLARGSGIGPLQEQLAALSLPVRRDAPRVLTHELVRVDRLNVHEGLNPGFRSRMLVTAVLGTVVLLIAAVNFVNLQTARSALRAREVAVRKIAGAGRGTLMLQFLCESVAYAFVAGLLGLALSEWLLPRANAFLGTGAALDYRGDPGILAGLFGTVLLAGTLAGAWPSFVTSGFRPVAVLRGETVGSRGAVNARKALVAAQFGLLIALAICAGIVHRQREYAMTEGLRLDGEQVLIVYAPRSRAFADEVRALPGVRAVSRASTPFLGTTGFRGLRGVSITSTRGMAGQMVSMNTIGADFDLFDFYGLQPIAGTLPRADGSYGRDAGDDTVVLNEAAVRALDLGDPAEAVGKPVRISTPRRPGTPANPVESVLYAVVPDFSLGPVTEAVAPTLYFQPGDPGQAPDPELVNVRLSGADIPETLAAIDRLWREMGRDPERSDPEPLRFFLDEHIQNHYLGVLRQAQAFGICAMIAVVLACIGLFALTAAAAERRTREIGLRKALGAGTPAIARLLLWQFTRPVLWGAVIAWPAAAWAMHRWLQGFAYRIDLPLWLFPAATATAVLIAALTVTAHTLAVARTRPARALRHE